VQFATIRLRDVTSIHAMVLIFMVHLWFCECLYLQGNIVGMKLLWTLIVIGGH
jgi:hypothetical protein